MTYTRYKSKMKVARKVNYDTSVKFRIDTKLLNDFKKIVGQGYQTKIRELMQDYVDKYYKDKYDRYISMF